MIQLLDGNLSLESLLKFAEYVAMSVVTVFEFLSYSELTDEERERFARFRAYIKVYGVPSDDDLYTQMIVSARQKYGLKLPDAIIAATARANDLTILTADDHFKHLKSPWKVRFYKPI